MATLTVRGTASVPAEPDEATVAIALSAVKETPEAAYRSVAERAAVFEQVCLELGIERGQRSTAGISVQTEVEWLDGRQELRGYRAVSRTHVRLREPALVASLLERAVTQAEAHVEGPWWAVDLDNPARLEACRRAAAAARRKAEAYAESLGVELGPLEGVTDCGVSARGAVHFAAVDASAEVPVHPGEQAVSAAVEVTYRIAEG